MAIKIKKTWFMLRKLLRDLNGNRHVPVNRDNDDSRLGYYYIRFEENPVKLNRLIHSYDENGVPLNRAYIDVEENRLHYYPISIGQYGLAIFHSWLKSNDISKRDHFLRIAEWFMKNRVDDDRLGTFWLTDIPKPEYNVYKPWRSAFSQSRGLSILLRAWQITGNERYLAVASHALIPFTIDISDGGVSVDRNKGETFYEEYVATYPTRVLDGHLFSLFGLYDYIRAVSPELRPSEHKLACKLFNEGVEGVVRQLPYFDMDFWLRFNRCDIPEYPQNDPCTIGYLRLVRQQLLILAEIIKNSKFAKTTCIGETVNSAAASDLVADIKLTEAVKVVITYAEKCYSYDKLPNILKMYRHKYSALKKLNRL